MSHNSYTHAAKSAFAITPNDTSHISPAPRALWVGNTGDLTVVMAEDTDPVTFLQASGLMPISVHKILSTGTTATDIVGLM